MTQITLPMNGLAGSCDHRLRGLPLTNQESNMNTEINMEMHSTTRELAIDELEVVTGGTGHIVIRSVFDDLFFNPGIKVVVKD